MNYDRLILASLHGDTPRQKYENLMAIQRELVKLCYPRRGTEDERMTAEQFANNISNHFHTHETVVNNPELDFK